MSRQVLLTDDAARDLEDWYAAAYARGGEQLATRILDRVQDVIASLANVPSAGSPSGSPAAAPLRHEPVPELRQLGVQSERQHVTEDGLRLVFREHEQRVVVVLIAPVERSFQSLLERRLLDA